MTWKLQSGIKAAKLLLSEHMDEHMNKAQKGIGKNTRGAKHQLFLYRTVSKDCKQVGHSLG